jgi:hypothetical protein
VNAFALGYYRTAAGPAAGDTAAANLLNNSFSPYPCKEQLIVLVEFDKFIGQICRLSVKVGDCLYQIVVMDILIWIRLDRVGRHAHFPLYHKHMLRNTQVYLDKVNYLDLIS